MSQQKEDRKLKKQASEQSEDQRSIVKKKSNAEISKPLPVSRESKLKPILMSTTPGVTLFFGKI